MKTQNKIQMKVEIQTILITATILLFTANVFGQKGIKKCEKYLQSIPQGLILKENKPQKMRITTDYYNRDIYGNFFNKVRITGDYTREADSGYVHWNNVREAQSNDLNGAFPEGKPLDYMENFRYKPSDKMMDAVSFKNFPQQSIYAKNLIWDMMGTEAFAWLYLDSLKLNQPYSPALNGKVELAGNGYFQNNHIKLTWTGISEMNNELCVLIQYLALDNPLDVNMGNIAAKGRSHYWGDIWVSLEDKQIEHAVLYEDVILDMNISPTQKQLVDATREIKFEKIQ